MNPTKVIFLVSFLVFLVSFLVYLCISSQHLTIMAQTVFINATGYISLTQKSDSITAAQIHRLQGRTSFEDEIDRINYEGLKVEIMNFEWAHRVIQSPYTKNSDTVCYFDNIMPI